jgi:hypothetical protein
MPKKKPKTTPKKPSSRLLRNTAFTAVALLAVFVLVNWLIITPRAIANERQKFENASEELEKIANEIESLVGPADKRTEDSSCGRARIKFSEGPLICDVTKELLYESYGLDKANQALELLSAISQHPVRNGSGVKRDQTGFVGTDKTFRSQDFYQKLDDALDLTCSATYRYPSIGHGYLDYGNSDMKIILTCGGESKTEHFDLRN